MALDAYKENLEFFSKRLPFECKQFIETFKELSEYYHIHPTQEVHDLYDKYKLVLLYTLKIKCKLVDEILISLIPNRINEFEEIVSHKKNYIFDIYYSGVITVQEYKEIYETIESERREILYRTIENKIIIANLIPSFRNIKKAIKFAEFIKKFDSSIDIKFVYKWRRKHLFKVIINWMGV